MMTMKCLSTWSSQHIFLPVFTLFFVACTTASSPMGGQTSGIKPDPQASAQPSTSTTGTTPNTASTSTTSSACEVTDAHETWVACEGKQTVVRGKKSQMVMQHPVVAMPMLEPGKKAEVQDYLDAHGRQIIVVGTDHIACAGEVSVTGTLRGIQGRGAPGTKESYRGWYLKGATFECH